MKMKMQIPGFTAESALVKAKGVYGGYRAQAVGGEEVAPAASCPSGYAYDVTSGKCVRELGYEFAVDFLPSSSYFVDTELVIGVARGGARRDDHDCLARVGRISEA